jgi:hypothetical protein
MLGAVSFGTAAVYHDADEIVMGTLVATGLCAIAHACLGWAAPALVDPSDADLPVKRAARSKLQQQGVSAVVILIVMAAVCNLVVWGWMPSRCSILGSPRTVAMHAGFDLTLLFGAFALLNGVVR